MLVNHGPSQQSSKEEYKPWKWSATTRYYASHTKTMLPTRKAFAKIQQVNGPHVRSPGHRKETQAAVVAGLVNLSHKMERKKAAEAYSSPCSVSVSYLQKSVICRHSECEWMQVWKKKATEVYWEREKKHLVHMMNWNQKNRKNKKICKARSVSSQIVCRTAWLQVMWGWTRRTKFWSLRVTKAASARDARTCIARCTRMLNGDFLPFLFSPPHRTDRVCAFEDSAILT